MIVAVVTEASDHGSVTLLAVLVVLTVACFLAVAFQLGRLCGFNEGVDCQRNVQRAKRKVDVKAAELAVLRQQQAFLDHFRRIARGDEDCGHLQVAWVPTGDDEGSEVLGFSRLPKGTE